MEIKEWLTFVTVVEEGNITKAAEKLFLSQPALSYRLKQIEDSLAVPLLLRTNDGIALTAEGEVYYEYCRRMIREREELQQTLGQITGEIQGTLKIASSINFADYQLPFLLNKFMEQYPKVHIEVKTGYSSQVNKMFNAGDIMVAFARGHANSSRVGTKLFDEPYCLVYKEPIEIEELTNVPMISYRTDASIAMVVDEWCSENLPKDIKPSMELDSMMTCRRFVAEGLGWAILPYMGLNKYVEEGMHIKPLHAKDGTPLTRSTYLYCNESSTRLVAVKTFMDYVSQYYENYDLLKSLKSE